MLGEKVAKEAKADSYVSVGGETCKLEVGSEDYVIVYFSKDVYVDISLRSHTCTVYDQDKKWNVRQIGTHSGRLIN